VRILPAPACTAATCRGRRAGAGGEARGSPWPGAGGCSVLAFAARRAGSLHCLSPLRWGAGRASQALHLSECPPWKSASLGNGVLGAAFSPAPLALAAPRRRGSGTARWAPRVLAAAGGSSRHGRGSQSAWWALGPAPSRRGGGSGEQRGSPRRPRGGRRWSDRYNVEA